MKYLYVASIGRSSASGVVNKVLNKVNYLSQKLDIEALLIFQELDHISISFRSNVKVVQSKADFFSTAIRHIDTSQFDCIIMRYQGASKRCFRFLQKCQAKVVFEHNSIEGKEKWFYIKSFNIRDYAYLIFNGKFKTIYREWLSLFDEYWYSKKCLSLAYAGITVTDEIARYEKCRYKKYITKTISNGINTEKVLKRSVPSLDDSKPFTMIFFSGTDKGWHGLDRLLRGIKNYTGAWKLRLFIIGLYHKNNDILISQINNGTHEVVCTGMLDSPQMKKYADESHIGIGSLGLHRIPLYQACTLKTREYCALGLPLMISHDDIDLTSYSSFAPFYLKVPASEVEVSIQAMIDFSNKVYEIVDFDKKMRTLCEKHLDMSVKMDQLSLFLESAEA